MCFLLIYTYLLLLLVFYLQLVLCFEALNSILQTFIRDWYVGNGRIVFPGMHEW